MMRVAVVLLALLVPASAAAAPRWVDQATALLTGTELLEGTGEEVIVEVGDRAHFEYSLVQDDGTRLPLAHVPGRAIRTGEVYRIRAKATQPMHAVTPPIGTPTTLYEVHAITKLAQPLGLAAAAPTQLRGVAPMLHILVRFEDDPAACAPGGACTPGEFHELAFGGRASLAAALRRDSHGLFSVAGETAGYFTLPLRAAAGVHYSVIRDEAIRAARAAGYAVDEQFVMIWHYPTAGAPHWGIAVVMPWQRPGQRWGIYTWRPDVQVMLHEFGHMIGLLHLHAWACPAGELAAESYPDLCTHHEYGGRFSPMGGAPEQARFSCAELDFLGWLDGPAVPGILRQPSGRVALTALGAPGAGGVRCLDLRAPSGRRYLAEYRPTTATDQPAQGGVKNDGLVLHLDQGDGRNWHQVPAGGQPGILDPVLRVGERYADLELVVRARDAETLTVQLGAVASPSPTATPASTSSPTHTATPTRSTTPTPTLSPTATPTPKPAWEVRVRCDRVVAEAILPPGLEARIDIEAPGKSARPRSPNRQGVARYRTTLREGDHDGRPVTFRWNGDTKHIPLTPWGAGATEED